MNAHLTDEIAQGKTDLVIEFVESGGAVTAELPYDMTPLKWCGHFGDVSGIKFLLSKGATLASLGENYDLNGAVFHGHLRLTEFLIEHGADVNFPLPGTAETPLHAALCTTDRRDRDTIIKILLDAGANPNVHTAEDAETDAFMRDIRTRAETPLHRAAAYANEETIQLLIDAGAKPDAKDMHGDSPLTWASWHLRPRAVLRKLCYGEFRA